MFRKILIANRGEIACRIIRTARRMGIETVAVYSEADAGALHVRMADEAIGIGPAPAAESYLDIGRILEAIRDSGAEAVHPGFGFLAENAGFAETLEAEGAVFIGPGASAIAAMGDKIESKRLAAAVGVSTVPGHDGAVGDADEAARIAGELGYPVMLKATAGGGGKGMRIARDEVEVREGFNSAANEARSSFGDERLLIEKFVEEPRHIEIQVLADAHGNCVHLGERECSIQRRNQKVIEEAPSPLLDPETREAMGNQAVALARAVDYRSTGTVEFIVDAMRQFYFLEMNTRLQVEHPVTEMITGLDLVEQMIRISAGERLALQQEDVRFNGWSLECRIYAEDPARDFVPSVGRLTRCRPPPEAADIRIDTGVEEGSEISMFYDPMIAKLITHGPDRADAIEKMRRSLDAYYIRGINHNVGFLAEVVGHPRFREGRLSTNFIEDEFADRASEPVLPDGLEDVFLAAAVLVHRRALAHEAQLPGQLPHHAPKPGREWVVELQQTPYHVGVEAAGESGLEMRVADRAVTVESTWQPGQPLLLASMGDRSVTVQVDRVGMSYRLSHAGTSVSATVRTPRAAELAQLMPEKSPPDLSKYLLCPMSGLVVAIHVSEGEEVKAGQPLAVVEAMKMENVLRAERDGTVAQIKAAPGESLAADHVILEFTE